MPAAFCTIGTVSEIVERARKNWTANAARCLYELELKAKEIRDRLEHADVDLADVDHMATDLQGYVSTFVKLVDRAQGLRLAGIE